MAKRRELVMTISLNALEHLGINLYSNVPAVLSEIVANAWDADAKKVKITIDKVAETITIEDDGLSLPWSGRASVTGFGSRRRRAILSGSCTAFSSARPSWVARRRESPSSSR